MKPGTLRDLRSLRSMPTIGETTPTIENQSTQPTLKNLITLGIHSFPSPPWEGKSKNAEHFFEVTSIHKDRPDWKPIFAAQSVIRNVFVNTLPQETTSYLTAADYEKLVLFLDDVFVYMEGLYGLITNESTKRKIVPPTEYVQVPRLTLYPYDTKSGLLSLFEPKKLTDIEKELSPFAKDLIDGVVKKCVERSGFIVQEGQEAGSHHTLHEIQLRHYLSLLHHFITEMKYAVTPKK